MRIKITLSYDGSTYFGSQSQTKTSQTIMGVFYTALKNLHIDDTKITAAGRTDKKVHAFRQVFHIDIPTFWNDLHKLKTALNHQLPTSLHVRDVVQVKESFHARFSAKKRAYRYILSDAEPTPFEANYVTFIKEPLKVSKLREAIVYFEGEHNFEFFKKTGSDSENFTRIIYKTRVYSHQNKTILYFEANGFLYSQIRLMVGFLLKINANTLTCKELKEQLECKQLHTNKPAPANGLYLSNIMY